MAWYASSFQIQATCLVAADLHHNAKTLHPQVIKHQVFHCCGPQCIHWKSKHSEIALCIWFILVSVSWCTDYFSLKSGSRPSSPGPSPTPSVAGSVTSSSSSAHHRRPLISPARLNISGQKLRLFSSEAEPRPRSPPLSAEPAPSIHRPRSPPFFSAEPAPSIYSGRFSPDISPFQSQNGKYCCCIFYQQSHLVSVKENFME